MQLILKSIYEILNYNFFIPSYQRGYKWDRQQVLDLLNDIYDFSQSEYKGFYCLQPIVVLAEKIDNETRYIIIDGEQRLTTIYIILKYLKEARKIIFNSDNLFTKLCRKALDFSCKDIRQ